MKLVYILLILSYSQLAFSAPAKSKRRVAVIFNGGDEDPSGEVGVSLQETADRSKRLYQNAGYDEVIVLSAADANNPATQANVARALAKQRNVTDFQYVILTHGVQMPTDIPAQIPKKDLQTRFPATPISPTVQPLRESIDGRSDPEARYMLVSTVGDNIWSNSVGMGDMRSMLENFKKNNPQAQITVYSGSCNGSALSYALADIPNTQIFTSSSAGTAATQYAREDYEELLDPSKYEDYVTFLQSALAKGKNFHAAHFEATQKTILRSKKERGGKSGHIRPIRLTEMFVPRSPMQEYVTKWCDSKAKQPPCRSCSNEPAVKTLTDLSDLTLRQYHDDPAYKVCENENLQEKEKEFNQETLKSAVEDMKKVVQELPSLEVAQVQARFLESLLNENHQTDPQLASETRNYLKQLRERINAKDADLLLNIEQQRGIALQKLDVIEKQCVNHQVVHSQSTFKCDTDSILDEYKYALSNFAGVGQTEFKKAYKDMRAQCPVTAPGEPSYNIENVIARDVECLKGLKVPSHNLLYLEPYRPSVSKECEGLEAVRKLIASDQECLARFTRDASKDQWARFSQLYDMGLTQVSPHPISLGTSPSSAPAPNRNQEGSR